MEMARTHGWRGFDEGGKLKEAGTSHWQSPNTGATNESGFSALPAGYRCCSNGFFDIGFCAYFWSTTSYKWGGYFYRQLDYEKQGVYRSTSLPYDGLSIRCVKD